MNVLLPVLVGLVAVVVGWFRYREEKKRDGVWREFAAREGMLFLGGDFPEDFPLGAPGIRGDRCSVAGVRHGEQVICYQFRTGYRGFPWATAVGCKQRYPERWNAEIGDFNSSQRFGEWMIVWDKPNSAREFWVPSPFDEETQPRTPDEVLAAWELLRTSR